MKPEDEHAIIWYICGCVADILHPRKPGLFAMQATPGISATRSTEVSLVELVYCIDFSSCSRDDNAYALPVNNFWEFQYNDPSAQTREQLDGFVYSNICFYVPNITCNTSSVWLKSPTIYIT